MKKIYSVSLVVTVLLIIGVIVYTQIVKPALDNRTITDTAIMPVKNLDLDFGFTYPSGESGFALIEPPVPTTTSDGLQKVYVLMDTQEYVLFQSNPDQGETPPSVSVLVVKMPVLSDELETTDRLTRLKAWAELYPQYSSATIRTGQQEIVDLDGVPAIRYSTDGLYQQEVYLVSYKGNVYVFTGQFDSESDTIHSMFMELIRSVEFY